MAIWPASRKGELIMAWIFSIGLMIASIVFKNDMALIASGLFAIAGSIEIWLNQLATAIKNNKDKKD